MEKTIKLNARSGTDNHLEHLASIYVLKAQYPQSIRCAYDPNDEKMETPYMIDPPDGPCIYLGDTIDGMTVQNIGFVKDVGFTITLSNVNQK